MTSNSDNRYADDMKHLSRENAFYKRLNEDMLQGMQAIYKEIAQLAEDPVRGQARDEGGATIFHEASRQLEEVMDATLRAADDIMNRVEAIQENDLKMRQTLEQEGAAPAAVEELRLSVEQNLTHVNAIVEALSFQDLTGQRLKKVVNALGRIHRIVVQTYVSAGLMIKKIHEEPERDMEAVAAESKKQAEDTLARGPELRGPASDSSQKDVDDLLAKLGF